ncbi:MAG TPA: carbohydrate-binding family 9-like protein [Candidatus Sphingobacterium stercoripullorum]|nr:carbohydrate-binding family 9-like protein [Candidatus Sphingobacterium stercoripullorum]
MQLKKLNYTPSRAEDVKALLESEGVEVQYIDRMNWVDQYPFKPDVTFKMAYTDEAFLLHYSVKERELRAVEDSDNGRIWEDACVEFFIAPFEQDFYYNFEFNCTGRLLLYGGAKGDRIPAPEAVLKQIKRWSSLGNEPFKLKEGENQWELSVIIPFTAFFRHEDERILEQESLRANFYKCGDNLPTPHFLSWKPIKTEKPNFHTPEFFGSLVLEK